MSLNVCAHCTTKFAIGLAHCPQCGNADYYEEGSMAKISRHGGASYVGEQQAEPVTVLAAVVVETVEPVSRYEGMLRSALQDECAARNLPTSGNKPELVARLAESDTAAEFADAALPA